MGDSACLVHAFSYTSAIPTEPKQGNPSMHGLGESVSLGRFMSESLAWEKWSTFSHNRYVEEAERYAQPGSVAQKKAFFEAHYKRIAARKAAALLEQDNNAITTTTQPLETETESVVHFPDAIPDSRPVTSNSSHVAQAFHERQPPPEEEPKIQTEDSKPDFMVTGAEYGDIVQNSNPREIFLPTATDEKVVKPKAPPEIPPVEFPVILKTQELVSGSDEPQLEKPLLQQNISPDQDPPLLPSKKKSAFSSLKSSVYRKTSKVPCSPAKPITPRIKKVSRANSAATPITNNKKHALDFKEKKISTPKPVNTFVNATPVKQLSNLLSPAARATRKMDNSRIVPDSCKRSQNSTIPLGIQNTEPSAKMSKDASAETPFSANTRAKTPVDGKRNSGPKWHILSAVYSKSLSACRNKLQSPTTLSTPFIFRTEERAARRKQKLEEKFNSKDIEKVQLQTSLKEKAESELRKLRHSFCFKARPLPDFYKEREAKNNQTKKNPVTKPESLTRLPSSNTLHKNGILKPVSERKGQSLLGVVPASSLQERLNQKNATLNTTLRGYNQVTF